MSVNLGWLFNKDYFEGINYVNMESDTVKASNQILIEQKVDNLIETPVSIEAREEDEKLGNSHFKATTTYPGLLLGIGNGHELPSIKGQAILGFHFDYTTGLPEITGSSIKGVLRSAFNTVDNYGYIKELLYDEMKLEKDSIDVEALELEIFGQTNGSSDTKQGKDVFFDAYIMNAVGTVLGDDYITPHGDNPLTEPIPLRFIKVMPEVTYMFDFELYDGVLSASNKNDLFRLILNDLGLGAKTNVGYGYFENFQTVMSDEEKIRQRAIELKAKCDKIIASYDISVLKEFISSHPDAECIGDVTSRVEHLERERETLELRKKGTDTINRGNRNHIQSFYDTHKDNEAISDIIAQAYEVLHPSTGGETMDTVDFDSILKETNYAEILKMIESIEESSSDDNKQKIKEYLENCFTKKIKGKQIGYPVLRKYFGDKEGQELGDKLKK